MYYILYFLAGLFAGNGVPHFVQGVTGQKYRTPFGQPSSAMMNVVWGSFNFAAAWALWHYAGLHRSLAHTVRYEVAFGLGVFVIAIVLAYSRTNSSSKTAK